MIGMIVIWTLVVIASIYLEANTSTFVCMWFIPAGIVSLIMAIFAVDIRWQIVAFALIAAVMLLLSRTIFKKYLHSRDKVLNNVDRLVGMNAVVVKKISDTEGTGEVKVDGKYWRAVMLDKSTAEEGEILKVHHIESTKVFCER